jgi:enoyl-[acyl-carrier protein] reductase III
MTQQFRLNGWALVLGASSGFGEAVSIELAKRGMSIIGVHLDRRATMPHVEGIQAKIREAGGEAWFFNVNAADEQKRAEVLGEVRSRFNERKKGETVQVLLHSLAFGTLKPYWTGEPGSDPGPGILNKANIDMTLDVMAHSLVYWTQDALKQNLMGANSRVYAMTSAGSSLVWSGYGAVSAAKAALEAHIRQLAVELAPRKITANAICAGVTDTPALRKIPGSDAMIANATQRNPYKRLTTPEDVAQAIAALSLPETHWITGNTLYVDGGEIFGG